MKIISFRNVWKTCSNPQSHWTKSLHRTVPAWEYLRKPLNGTAWYLHLYCHMIESLSIDLKIQFPYLILERIECSFMLLYARDSLWFNFIEGFGHFFSYFATNKLFVNSHLYVLSLLIKFKKHQKIFKSSAAAIFRLMQVPPVL